MAVHFYRMKEKQQRKLGTAATASMAGIAITGTIATLEVGRRLFRNARLFTPSNDPIVSWDPADYGFDPARVDELTFRSPDGPTLYGWYCRAKNPIASAVLCHGKSGNLTNVAAGASHLVDRGISVFLFDYRGFGRSSGRPSVAGVVRDVIAAARRHETLRPRGVPSLLYGYSLGGAIAAQAIQFHPFDGLILQSTFTSLPEMTRVSFPRLPMHLISGRIFDTTEIVGALTIPMFVIHGSADEIVPCTMGERLFRACPSARGIEIIDGGLHRNLFEVAPQRIVEVLARFVGGLPPAPVPVRA